MVPTKEMKMLRAFHGEPKLKEKFVARVKKHEKLDEIVQGKYWENGKGCAVGCTLEYDNKSFDIHKQYENELGIPEAIAYTEDSLFERMSNADAKVFPRKLLEAIPVGADLSLVPAKLIVFILDDVLGFNDTINDKAVFKAVAHTRDLWKKTVAGKKVSSAAWSAARSAAESAAWSAARSAAESAARSAAWSAAWSAAESAARSAAWSAARSAAWSAAWSAAESAAAKKYGDALIRICAESPID